MKWICLLLAVFGLAFWFFMRQGETLVHCAIVGFVADFILVVLFGEVIDTFFNPQDHEGDMWGCR